MKGIIPGNDITEVEIKIRAEDSDPIEAIYELNIDSFGFEPI